MKRLADYVAQFAVGEDFVLSKQNLGTESDREFHEAVKNAVAAGHGDGFVVLDHEDDSYNAPALHYLVNCRRA